MCSLKEIFAGSEASKAMVAASLAGAPKDLNETKDDRNRATPPPVKRTSRTAVMRKVRVMARRSEQEEWRERIAPLATAWGAAGRQSPSAKAEPRRRVAVQEAVRQLSTPPAIAC